MPGAESVFRACSPAPDLANNGRAREPAELPYGGGVNTYMTTTRARYCNHSPPRTKTGPGEATMGGECLVEAGKVFRNASERPGEGLCDFEKNAVKKDVR